MITYVDTSTLLKLVIYEAGSDRAEVVWDAADTLASVSLIVVEARAALAAATRGGRLTAEQYEQAKAELSELIGDLHLARVTDDLVTRAAGLAETEALRGYDAVHLAAALHLEAGLLTSADEALCEAAAHNGMHVANPLAR
ncbi:MAG: type II toxin-antitoxin system VapC family toxin [Actinomycetota bacterium]